MIYRHLTAEHVEQFLEKGYVVVKGAFTQEKAEQWAQNIWVRLGLDPEDKTTWDRERIHMPFHKREHISTFAPKAYEVMKELLGGEDRIDVFSATWGDGFIVNLGLEELVGKEPVDPRELDNWHVDGDFFVHFLDSPEQALLIIPIFSDIKPNGGGTIISPDGLNIVAKYLASHPEGLLAVDRCFIPSTSADPHEDPNRLSHLQSAKKCNEFIEMTGSVGDVIFLHPLMMHTASKNHLREPRIIINPPVSLRSPFKFAREDAEEYSLVERKTLKALGVSKLDFKPSVERRKIMPKANELKQRMLVDEQRRLVEHTLGRV